MASILSNLLAGGNTLPASAYDPKDPNYSGAYTPDPTIAQQYTLASALRNVGPAKSWAGVVANGLGAVGGNIVQGDADQAAANNQQLRQESIKNVGNATDQTSLTKALLNSSAPDVQDLGLRTKVDQIVNDPNKAFTVRDAQARKFGLVPGTQTYQDFVLTGKMPDLDSPMNVKEWRYFQSLPADQQTQYLTMKRANPYLDTGLNFVRPNPANPAGAPQAVIPKNVEGTAAAKKAGELNAEGANSLPKAAIALKQYDASSSVVNDSIDKALGQANGWTTGLVGSATSAIPGTPAHDLANTLNTIKSNLGFDRLQDMRANSPTGGALGAVSDMENRLLQQAWASVEQSQSVDQLRENLGKIKALRQQYSDLKHQAYAQDVARFGSANVPNPDSGQMPRGAGRQGKAGSPLDNAIGRAMEGNSAAPQPSKRYIWTPNGGLQEAP